MLGVIVLNYNSYEDTINYVKSIEKFKTINKIIVVDNCSTNDSFNKMKILNSKKVDVISSHKNGGYSYGNNVGIKYLLDKYGKFDYICISNSDIIIDENAFKESITYLNNHDDVAIVSPRMHDANDNPHMLSGWKLRTIKGDIKDSSLLLTKYNSNSHSEKYSEDYFNKKEVVVDCVPGSFFIIKEKVFEEIGFFDENLFLYFEEDVIGNKIHKLGYKNVVLNNIKFIHMESVTINKTYDDMKKFKQLQKSKRYYHKNYNNASKIELFLLDFFTYFRPFEEKVRDFKFKFKDISNKNLILYLLKKNIRWIIHIFKLITVWIFKSIFGFFALLFFIIMLPISFVRSFFNKDKVLYNSLVSWKWIKQRPHYVADYLALNGFKVTYASQNLFPKFRDNSQSHCVNKIENNNLKIKEFNIFPERGLFIYINIALRMFRYLTLNYDKIIFTHPNQLGGILYYILKFRKADIYYECMDNYIGWETDKDRYEFLEKRLINASTHVFVSATGLKNQLIKKYNVDEDKITIVRNGYDNKLFENPKKIKTDLHKNSVTYIGTVDEWFDFDKVCKYAKKHPNVHFEIIGPVGFSAKERVSKIKEKNIHFHGPIEHECVPQYIMDSDVLFMPFILNDVIKFVDPVKVYEYLYFKKNVVTSYWKELDQFKDLVYFYVTYDEFEKQIDSALKDKFSSNKNYKELMEESKWDNRLNVYKKELKKKNKINKKTILIFILLLTLLLQINFLNKDSCVKNIINLSKSYSYTETNSFIFALNNEIVKKSVEDESTIALYIDSDSGMNTGLLYYFSSYDLYPNKLYNTASYMDLTTMDEEIVKVKNDIKINTIDYIMCFSSCDWFTSEYSIDIVDDEYAFLLIKNNNGNLNIIYNEKFDINRYYDIFKSNDNLDVFNNYITYLKHNSEIYDDGFSYKILNELEIGD